MLMMLHNTVRVSAQYFTPPALAMKAEIASNVLDWTVLTLDQHQTVALSSVLVTGSPEEGWSGDCRRRWRSCVGRCHSGLQD